MVQTHISNDMIWSSPGSRCGLVVGQMGLDRGLLTNDCLLARRWLLWLGTAVISFGAWAGQTFLTMPDRTKAHLSSQIAATIAFPIVCAAGCLFLLAVCLRFSRNRLKILDSLSVNAYAMCLVHYVFVVWLLYALLDSNLFSIAKFAVVLSCTVILSWASGAEFNRFVSVVTVPAKQAVGPVPHWSASGG